MDSTTMIRLIAGACVLILLFVVIQRRRKHVN